MVEDLRKEVEWLEHKMETLKKHIEEIERENHHLRSLVNETIQSLKKSNQQTKKMIYAQTEGSIRKDSESFTSYYGSDTKNKDDNNSSG
jgi:prefoldin subunit 5